ncbi:hypothetical protein Tco_1477935 [Tanacetum coccineum]
MVLALVDDKKVIITESTVRRDLQLEDAEGVDCLPNSTIFEQLTLICSKTTTWNEFSSTMASAIICLATNQKFNFSKFIFESMVRNLDNLFGKILMYPSLVRAATTASSLEAEQDSGNITKTRSKATPNESSSLGTTSGGFRCQETMGDTTARTRFESVSKLSNDLLLARGNTLGSDEDRLKLNELMELYDAANEMFDVNVLNGEEVFVSGQNENVVEEVVDAAQVSTDATTETITTKELNLAQALEALKNSKPKVKGIVFQKPGKSTTTTTTTISSQPSHDKGKGIMVEELVKPINVSSCGV